MQPTAAQRTLTSAQPNLRDESFSAAVIAWQRQHGRHALPWQNTRNAYRIWLSEIMLQQTQVAAVMAYYEKFLRSFPTVEALAAAPVEQVMAHWSGLGYYTRARNLHACAKRVVAEHGGRFPRDPAALAQLPGIGRSTAAAIAAFAYGVRAAILDGNVKRVLCRVYGVSGFPGNRAIELILWQRAEALLPPPCSRDAVALPAVAQVRESDGAYATASASATVTASDRDAALDLAADVDDAEADCEISSYTQGLMDLGATLCTRSRPQCARCPLAARCVARATGRTEVLPERKPKKVLSERQVTMLVVVHEQRVLLQQRPDKGIWGGLLSLPEIAAVSGAPGQTRASDAEGLAQIDRAAARFGTLVHSAWLTPFSHGFTHFKLHVTPRLLRLHARATEHMPPDYVWYDSAELAHAALPAPVKKLLCDFFGSGDLLAQLTAHA